MFIKQLYRLPWEGQQILLVKWQDVCLSVFMSVPKDLANRSTDMDFYYRVASHRSWEGW